jgi:hypothetical protein
MGGPPAWELGMRITALHCKKLSLLQNAQKRLELEWILWINDLSDRIWI